MVSYSTFPKKVELMTEFCQYLIEGHPHLGNYNDVVTGLKKAAKGRNRLFHNSYIYDDEKKALFRTESRGKSRWSTTKVNKADIRRVAMDIHQAMLKLHELVTGVSYPPIWQRGDS